MSYLAEMLTILLMIRDRGIDEPTSAMADDHGWYIAWGPYTLSRAHSLGIVGQDADNGRCEFNDRYDAVSFIKKQLDSAPRMS